LLKDFEQNVGMLI